MLVTDCDGCLTDGGMYYSENGDELKKFNTRDGMMFALLRKKGIICGIITGEDRELNRRRAAKMKLDFIKNGISDKLTVIKDQYLASGTLNPKALTTNPNILKYQVPGGMLSNLMSQLKAQGAMHRYEEVLNEIPRVRKDLGYPPLVTPLSQMVGTQAVMNVLSGERYKMCPGEIKAYLKGEYGQAPAEVKQEVQKKIIGDAEVITYRPADNIAPESDAMKAKYGNICINSIGRFAPCK
jgi:oxaloacetate decarboxylase alpha subunit